MKPYFYTSLSQMLLSSDFTASHAVDWPMQVSQALLRPRAAEKPITEVQCAVAD